MSDAPRKQTADEVRDECVDLARDCLRQLTETGVPRVGTLRVKQRHVIFAGATPKGIWYFPVGFSDEKEKLDVIRSFPELCEFAE